MFAADHLLGPAVVAGAAGRGGGPQGLGMRSPGDAELGAAAPGVRGWERGDSFRKARPLGVQDPRRHKNPLKVASVPWAAPSSLPPLRSGPREPCPSVSAQNRLTGVCRLTTALCQGGDRGHGFRGHPPVLPGALRGETAAASSRPRSPRLSPGGITLSAIPCGTLGAAPARPPAPQRPAHSEQRLLPTPS